MVLALNRFLLEALAYVVSKDEDLLYATAKPAPVVEDVLTKILLRSVSVGPVDAEIALDPNNAPDEDAAKLTVLKYAFTVVPPVMFKPIKEFAAFAAGDLRSPIRLL